MNQTQELFRMVRLPLRRGFLILFGMATALITFECLLHIWSAVYISRFTSVRNGSSDDFVVLTLGESTTAGDTDDIWPAQLGRLLEEKYPTRHIRIVNKAVPGTTTTILVGNLESQIEDIHPDVVISMMGINDTQRVNAIESAYTPNSQADVFMTQKFFRTTARLMQSAMRTWYDFRVNRDADQLSKKAEAYRKNGEFELSEKYFLRCIDLEPGNANHYVMLAIAYLDMQRIAEAETMFLKAKDVAPESEGVYTELGNYYRDYGKLDQAEPMFQRALTINPEYGLAYGAYATLLYWYRNDPALAMGMYEKSIALNPELTAPYFELADIYRSAHRYADAIALYQEVLRREPDNTLASRELANTTAALEGGVVAGVSIFAGETSQASISAITVENYRKMITLTQRHRIPVIAVQYPLSSKEPLEVLANESGAPSGLIEVVDNEKNFTEALRHMKYSDLFTDYFGGNFGHTTREGSRLIAERVAVAVEKILTAQ